jgi:pilus assembly protein FimV
MEYKFPIKAGLLASLLMLPWAADAAGLGKLTVTSALGQPLRGEIELVAVDKSDLGSINAHIASYEAFKQANIDRNPALSTVRFAVEQKPSGAAYIKVTSTQPINEPFLDMLIEVDWPSGRLVREYTVLLDPPGYEAATAAPAAAPVTAPVSAPATAPVAPAVPAPTEAAAPAVPQEKEAKTEEAKPAAAEKAVPAKAAPAKAETYGPVKKGETLAGIASELKPEGVSLDQMLVAFFRANKGAFAGNNMNRLKTGQILRVPEHAQASAVSAKEATKEVKVQAADWNAYRQKLAGAVAAAPAEKEEAAPREAAGKITAAVAEKAPTAKEAPKPVLKLSKGEAPAKPGAAGAKEIQALQERIQSLQEEATAREKTAQEANQRIAALEKTIKEMQHLLELKNQSLADLQKQAAAKAAPPAPTAPVAAPVAPVAPAAAPPAPPAEKPVVVEKPAPKPVVPPAKPKPQAPKPEEVSFLDQILATPAYLGGLAGALVLAILLAVRTLAARRKKKLETFEASITTGGELKPRTVMGRATAGQAEAGDTSFLTDFSQAGLGTIDTGEVDPVAEAEVYMAYGRDVQAEEILKEAMAKDPSRQEVRLKLLEIYAGRKNLRSFENLANELYATLGGQASPTWEKVAEMGRSIDPGNPLYGGARSPAPSVEPAVAAAAVARLAPSPAAAAPEVIEEAAPELDLNLAKLAAEEAAPSGAPAGKEAPEAPEELGAGLDFNLAFGVPSEGAPAEATVEATPVVDFDLGLPSVPEQQPAAEEALPAAEAEGLISAEAWKEAMMQLETGAPAGAKEAAEQPEGAEISVPAHEETPLDFEFTMAPEEAAVAEAPKGTVPELDLTGVSLDLEGEGAAAAPAGMLELSHEQEVATKLDLAKAYMEMGDKEGAREILEEVVKDGGAAQQDEARQLLTDLG